MTIAKNLAAHGVWGVTPSAFSSSSSSLVWPLLLAAIFHVIGPQALVPLAVNLFAATALVFVAEGMLMTGGVAAQARVWALGLLVVCTSLPALVISGMEHTAHALVTCAFVTLAVSTLVDTTLSPSQLSSLTALGTLAVGLRYEGLFVVAIVASLLCLRRHVVAAVILVCVSVLPVVVYALFSVGHGWYWLPNPVLLKGNVPHSNTFFQTISGLPQHYFIAVLKAPALAALLLGAFALLIVWQRLYQSFWNREGLLLIIWTITTVLQMTLASTGWFFRYEAYLIALAIVTMTLVICKLASNWPSPRVWSRRRKWLVTCGAQLILAPLLYRGYQAITQTPQASTNIYQQQVQMGLFLDRFYNQEAVAVNDIGAVTYFSDVKVFDLWGLGTLETAQALREHNMNKSTVDELTAAQHVRIAITHENLFPIPDAWIPVGEWTIPNNVVSIRDTVIFYALDPSEANQLNVNLHTFASALPIGMTYRTLSRQVHTP